MPSNIELSNLFKSILDILRSEGKTGNEALRILNSFLILKLLEPKFGVEIDIENYNYDISEEYKIKLMQIYKFSSLDNNIKKDENFFTYMKVLWDEILSVHPSTRNIYPTDQGFGIKMGLNYRKIIQKIDSVDFSKFSDDILGESYQEVIKDIMVGKVLGQFFTPLILKKIMIDLIQPKLFDDGTIESMCDPTMGTGGFLVTYIKNIIEQGKQRNIKLDWDNIKNSIHGKEINDDTFNLACSNMLISTGHPFDHLDKGDSLKYPIEYSYKNKFDNILANPPFGIKGYKYNDLFSAPRHDHVYDHCPISSNNIIMLFLQSIIYMLKIGGKCAIVLPDGQELFSNKKEITKIRAYLLKTCELHEIIIVPSNIFENTGVKTCILFFTKRKEQDDVLNVKITKKSREVTFKNPKQFETNSVKYYKYNIENNEKEFLQEVDITNIIENKLSLSISTYKKKEVITYNGECTYMKLGDICDIKIGGTPSRHIKEYYENGTNLWVTCKDLVGIVNDTVEKITDEGVKNSNVKLVKEGSILFSFALTIGKTSLAGKDLYTNQNIAAFDSLDKSKYLNKYIYYYLSSFNFDCDGRGNIGKGALNKQILEELEIPIPSIQRQKELITICDEYVKSCQDKNYSINKDILRICVDVYRSDESKLTIINICDSYNDMIELNTKKIQTYHKFSKDLIVLNLEFNETTNIKLGDICDIKMGGTPLREHKHYYENGTNLWVSVSELNYNIITDTKEKITDEAVKNSNVKLVKEGSILFSFKLSIGKTGIAGKNLYTNEAILGLLSLDENILLNKYLYYYLSTKDFSNDGKGILGKGSLNKEIVEELEIPIPSIKIQKDIISKCDLNNKKIDFMEKEITNFKDNIKFIINHISKQNEEIK